MDSKSIQDTNPCFCHEGAECVDSQSGRGIIMDIACIQDHAQIQMLLTAFRVGAQSLDLSSNRLCKMHRREHISSGKPYLFFLLIRAL